MKQINLIILGFLTSIAVFGQQFPGFHFQGALKDNNGIPVNETKYMDFRIYDSETGGTHLWNETHISVEVIDGLFSVELGLQTPFPTGLFDTEPLYITFALPSGEMTPRQKLLAVPYALNAREDLDWTIEADTLYSAADSTITIREKRVGIGNPNPDESAILDLTSDSQGLLFPRLTDEQILDIPNPSEGLVVYSLANQILVYFNGTEWLKTDGSPLVITVPEYSVFVSPNGVDDPSAGSMEQPFQTIMYALQQAQIHGNTEILIANGVYYETVYAYNGIHLYGGYNPYDWTRDLQATQTIIHGTDYLTGHRATLVLDNITVPTIIEGLIIYGENNQQDGGNSYAVYINNSNDNLQINDNIIYGGNGGNGQSGANGSDGTIGTDGIGRNSDPPAYDGFAAYAPCNSSNDRQYSNGGQLTPQGDDISGGYGGGNTCPPSYDSYASGISGQNGEAGEGPLGGVGGAGGSSGADGRIEVTNCYLPSNAMFGDNGENGQSGLNGEGGSGGNIPIGSTISGHWICDPGISGNNGGNGGGAGGGGAGGGGEYVIGPDPYDMLGGHGGGGGAGGEGGYAGTEGMSGGGSFGIFILGSIAPSINNNAIYLGVGGNGGNGGFGGNGGNGGAGGSGGTCSGSCWCMGYAGDGGTGGNGGHGGGGGGACGGGSFGIYTYNTSGSVNYDDPQYENTFQGGSGGNGGNGGLSLGNNGQAGLNGVQVNCSNN